MRGYYIPLQNRDILTHEYAGRNSKGNDKTPVRLAKANCFCGRFTHRKFSNVRRTTDISSKGLKNLGDKKLSIISSKGRFPNNEIIWVRYKFTKSGVNLPDSKTILILNLKPFITQKNLRSFSGSVHRLCKYTSNIYNSCHLLIHNLKKLTNST